MKNLILTEEEKRNILEKYKVGSTNSQLIEEYSRISELMGITPKQNIIKESSGSKINPWDLPIFSSFSKYFQANDALRSAIKSDFSDLSETLSQKGLTFDNIVQYSKEWYEKSKLVISKNTPQETEMAIVEAYLQKNFPKSLAEIQTGLYNAIEKDLNTTISQRFSALESGIKELKDENVKLDVSNESKPLDIDTIDETSLANQKSAIDDAIDQAERSAADARARAQKSGTRKETYIDNDNIIRTREVDMSGKYNDIAKQYDEYAAAMKKKKQLIEDTEVTLKKGQSQAGEIKYKGEVVDTSGWNFFQVVWFRILYSQSISSTLPLKDFFTNLGIVMKATFLNRQNRSLQDMFSWDAARYATLSRELEQNLNSLERTWKESELDALKGRMRATVIASIGRKGEVSPFGKDWTKYWFAIGKDVPQDVADAWVNIQKWVNQIEGITDLEKIKLLDDIKQRYMGITKQGEKEVLQPTSEFTGWRNFVNLTEDLETLSKYGTLPSETDKMNELTTSFSTGAKKSFKQRIGDAIVEAITECKKGWKSILGVFASKFFRYVGYGIPGGLRWILRPLSQKGITLKGFAQTTFNLYVAKLAVASASAIVTFVSLWGFGLSDTGAAILSYEGETGEQLEDRLIEQFWTSIQEAATSFPFYDFDIGWENEQKDLDVPTWRKYKAEMGIFKSHGLEFIMEMKYGKYNDMVRDSETFKENNRKEMREKIQEKATKYYGNLSVEQKNELKKGYNAFLKRAQNTTVYPGIDYNKIYFVSRTQINEDAVNDSKNEEAYFLLVPPDVKNLFGFPFYCTGKVDRKANGVDECKGTGYRITETIYDQTSLEKDGTNYKKYIYDANKDMPAAKGLYYDKYYNQIVYIKDSAFNFMSSDIPVGEDQDGELTNLGLLTTYKNK